MNAGQTGVGLNKWSNALLFWAVLVITFYLASSAWFGQTQFAVFASDDLHGFDAAKQGFHAYNQATIGVFRFRPVTAFIVCICTKLTNSNIYELTSLGWAIHTFNAILFFLLIHKVIKLNVFSSYGITLLAILNRFTTYLFLKEQALLEGFGITVFLLIVIISFLFIRKPTVSKSAGLILLYLILIHIHERYLVLALPLFLLALFSSRLRAFLGTGVILATGLNIFIKKIYLATPLLMGTGVQPIVFDPRQISAFFWAGILNLLGINRGPDYLSLEDFKESPFVIQILSIGAAIAALSLLAVICFKLFQEKKKRNFVIAGFLVTMILVLTSSACVTFRQEFRWLYPAYLAFLVLLAYGARPKSDEGDSHEPRPWVHLLLTLVILLSIPKEFYLAGKHTRYFAFAAYQIANNLFSTLQKSDFTRDESVTIRGDDLVNMKWLTEDRFSRVYKLPVLIFEGQNSPAKETSGRVIEYLPFSRSFRIIENGSPSDSKVHRMNYSVLEAVAGALPVNKKLETPGNKSLFPSYKADFQCMVAIAPVDIRISKPLDAGVLHVCFSHYWAKGDGFNIDIIADDEGKSATLISREIAPLPDDDFPDWQKYDLALPPGIKNIEIRIYSKSGNEQADWVAIRDFSFGN